MRKETHLVALIIGSIIFMAFVKITNVNNVIYDAWKPNKFGTYCTVGDAPDSTLQKWALWESLQRKDGTWSEQDINAIKYIERFKHTAKAEEKKYGIPYQITLAQGILESASGTSRMAKDCKNHFGIKCQSNSCKKGHCMNFSDDSHKDFFRKFKTDWESFREHSKVLEAKRYKPCHDCKTVECWAAQLQKCGYATSKSYEIKLLSIIKKYGI